MTFKVLRRLEDGTVVVLYEDGRKVRFAPKSDVDSPDFSREAVDRLTPPSIIPDEETPNPYIRRIPIYDWR